MMYTIVDTLLEIFTGEDFSMVPRPYESAYRFMKRYKNYEKRKFDQTLWSMQKRKLIKEYVKNSKKFIRCTKKGRLQILMKKAKLPPPMKWDGKFRLAIYDFPESNSYKRDQFRLILKQNSFIKLQGSVFISPYPLNRAAVRYLKETGLIEYVRLMRVDEMDFDDDIKKKFKL